MHACTMARLKPPSYLQWPASFQAGARAWTAEQYASKVGVMAEALVAAKAGGRSVHWVRPCHITRCACVSGTGRVLIISRNPIGWALVHYNALVLPQCCEQCDEATRFSRCASGLQQVTLSHGRLRHPLRREGCTVHLIRSLSQSSLISHPVPVQASRALRAQP